MNDAGPGTIAPGRYEDMANEDYHSSPGISKSHLDVASRSMLHYWDRYLNPDRAEREETAAMAKGTAIHTAILEPDMLESRYVQRPDGMNANSNAYKAFAAEAAESQKIVLKADEYAEVLAVRDAVARHPVASKLLRGGAAEQTFFAVDPETGELVKCRTDYLTSNVIIDVKKTRDARRDDFAKSVHNYRYHVQQAWYTRVLRLLYGECPPFLFLAIEDVRPFAIGIYSLEPNDVVLGDMLAIRDYRRIVAAKRANDFPGYGDGVQTLALPGWVKREIED